MSLHGRTDSNANKEQANIGVVADSQTKQIIYIDETEAALPQNKSRGLNDPGWWSYFNYKDISGKTRNKQTQLAFVDGREGKA